MVSTQQMLTAIDGQLERGPATIAGLTLSRPGLEGWRNIVAQYTSETINHVVPISGTSTVTSEYGMRAHPISGMHKHHDGVDFAGGTYVLASAGGVVLAAGSAGGYGNTVLIGHPDGSVTVYAHQADIRVSPGDRVDAGATIGTVGMSGKATGKHLHYEYIRPGGRRDTPEIEGVVLAKDTVVHGGDGTGTKQAYKNAAIGGGIGAGLMLLYRTFFSAGTETDENGNKVEAGFGFWDLVDMLFMGALFAGIAYYFGDTIREAFKKDGKEKVGTQQASLEGGTGERTIQQTAIQATPLSSDIAALAGTVPENAKFVVRDSGDNATWHSAPFISTTPNGINL